MSETITVSWEVEDGFAGPSRPKSSDISMDIVEDHMSDGDLEVALDSEVRDSFKEQIDFFITNEDQALDWMRECRNTLKELEESEDCDTDPFEGEAEFKATWGVEDGYAGKDRPHSTDVSAYEIESDMDDEQLLNLLRNTVRDDFESEIDFVITNREDVLDQMRERRDEIIAENEEEDEIDTLPAP